MAKVVILGGGFGGLAAAKAFERRYRSIDVLLIDKTNYSLFTPMLPEVASGTLETRNVAQPLRASLKRTSFELREAIGSDLKRRVVRVRHPVTADERDIAYDELVLALGSTWSTMGVDGVERWALPLYDLAGAAANRSRAIGALEVAACTRDIGERDALLRFTVVGGGFTGVEMAGELRAFLTSVCGYYRNVAPKDIEVSIADGGERLLTHLPPKFGKAAAKALARSGVSLRMKTKVDSVDRNALHLKGGSTIPTRRVIWCAGEEASPLAKALGLDTDRKGAIPVNADFAVPSHDHVWAIGDCAAVPKAGGKTYAPLAQNALREGPLLARNVAARLAGRPTKYFRYRELGQMASLGNRQAIAELPGGKMLCGFLAWMLWRAYYLGRLPGWGRKTHVALDWSLGMVFRPDIARLPMEATAKIS